MTMFTSNKKIWKIILYVMVCVLLCLWLLFSNNLIAKLSGSDLKKDHMENYAESTIPCDVHIDSIYIGGDLAQICAIKGWALGEATADNQERYTKYVFISDDEVYSVDATLSERTDVVAVYRDVLPEETSIELGALASFSPIIMKNGIYELYAYCWENEQEYGIVSTGMKFLKNGKTFEEYSFQSEETDVKDAQEKLAYYALDGISSSDMNLQIFGWGFLENMDCEDQEVYVRLISETESRTFTTEQRTREDVARAYENELYQESGFGAVIPLDQLESGSYRLELLLKNGDRIAGATKGTIEISEDGTVAYE